MFGKIGISLAVLLMTATAAHAQLGNLIPNDFAEFEVSSAADVPADQLAWAAACDPLAGWEDPGPPFRIHANTYYVGTCGISSILITTEEGHILIDAGTDAGAEIVISNIAALGFDVSDIKILLASHEHFDHVGGLAKIQQLSGARVMALEAAIDALASGESSPDDPQYGSLASFAPVEVTAISSEDSTVSLGGFTLNAIPTPGHTPGAASYNWFSCSENGRCTLIVYADSLSPVSSDGYRFSDRPELVAEFRESIARVGNVPCTILLTPHPSSSQFHERFARRTFAHSLTCPIYRNRLTAHLDARLAEELETTP